MNINCIFKITIITIPMIYPNCWLSIISKYVVYIFNFNSTKNNDSLSFSEARSYIFFYFFIIIKISYLYLHHNLFSLRGLYYIKVLIYSYLNLIFWYISIWQECHIIKFQILLINYLDYNFLIRINHKSETLLLANQTFPRFALLWWRCSKNVVF